MKKFVLWSVALLLLLPILFVALLTLMPARYLTQQIEALGSSITGGDLQVETVLLEIWQRQPEINVSGIQLFGPEGDRLLVVDMLRLSIDAPKLLGGVMLLPELHLSAPAITIERQVDGSLNWGQLSLLTDIAQQGERPLSENEETQQRPAQMFTPKIEQLLVTDARLIYLDQQRDFTAELTGSIESDSQSESPTLVAAEGSVNSVPVTLDIELPSLDALHRVAANTAVLENVSAQLEFAESAATVDGNVDLQVAGATDLDVSVSLTGTKNLQQMLGISLPELPPLRLQGRLTRDQSDYVLRKFDGRLAQSDLQGDLRLNPQTSPVTLYANIISTRLDIDDLAGLIGGKPDDSQQPDSPQIAQTTRLLPSAPIDLIPLTRLFNGAVEFRADTVLSGSWPVESFDTRFEINGTDVAIPYINVAIADGRVSGVMKLNAATQPPEIVAELNVRQVDLKAVMKSIGIDDDSFGIVGGEVKFWSKGHSVADFAAHLDGGMFLLMVNGKLDALLAELAGIDLLESLALIVKPGKSLTDIRCAYLDVLAEQGTVDIGTMVLDTTDTLFIADGQLDLAAEELNLTVEPHPKDVSIIASKTSAVIRGPLSNLSVLPGTSLTARTAVAASLAGLASPVTALLPFVQLGTQSNSHYCSGLIESIDNER
jgi:uncharacterized protein involved in outer membrane biogenesis